MLELQWNETDFLRCLEVEPQIEEYETRYTYRVEKDGLILEINVHPHENVIGVSLAKSGHTFVKLWLLVNYEVQYINDKRGEYLECFNCVLIPSRFYQTNYGRDIDKGNFLQGINFRIRVKPEISLTFE